MRQKLIVECVQSELLDNEIVFPLKPSLWGSHDNTKISNPLVSLSSIMLRPQKKLCVQSELLDDATVFPVKSSLWGSHDNTKITNPLVSLSSIMLRPQKKLCVGEINSRLFLIIYGAVFRSNP